MGYTFELETIKLHKAGNRFFSYYATEEEERESGLGRIHVILEIASKDKSFIAFASELVAVIKDTFFHSPSSDIEASLELACQKANTYFLDSDLDHNKCYSKLSCVVFATHENSISFSSITNGNLLLLRKQKINHLTEPTFSKTKKESGKPKLFTNITSGLLEPGDFVIASTRSITDYFNEEKLKTILRQLKLPDAAKAITDELQKIPTALGFEGALASFKKRPPIQHQEGTAPVQPNDRQTVIESMSQMKQRESVTSKYLVESPAASFKKMFHAGITRMKSVIARTERAAAAPKPASTDPAPQGAVPKPSIVPPSISEEAFGTRIHKISSTLFVKNRFLTIGSALLILFIATTILQTRLISFSSQDSQSIAAIRELINQAELALIYKNREGALADLKQAREQFQSLKKPESSDAKELLTAMQTISRSVYLIADQTPEPIAELSSFGAPNPTKGVLTSKGALYSFTSNPFQLLEIKQSDKSAEPVPIEIELKPERSVGDADNILVSDGTTLASLDVAKKSIVASSPVASLVFTPYAGRAYAVTNNTIVRLDRDAKTNTWKSTPWITDGTTIQNARSIAIDGDIYVGIDGMVLKFTKGQKQSFILPDFGFSAIPSAIATSIESDRLFILDALQKRIMIVTKNGTLEKQISLETFDQAISPSLVVDEIKKSIFFHTETGIWKVMY